MKNKIFNAVRSLNPKRNVFDLSHEKKLSINSGLLYPIFLQEILPSDKFRVKSEMLIRMAPTIAPIMDRLSAYVHYFFVPNRLVFDGWEDFITGGKDGTSLPTFPLLTINDGNKTEYGVGTLADYFGIPTPQGTVGTFTINALPFRAYNLIYNEYYRDQNLSDPAPLTDRELKRRCYRKDYFTSALPWTQRGSEVMLPNTINYSMPARSEIAGGTPAQGAMTVAAGDVQSNGINVDIQNIDSLEITINDLRKSWTLQKWLERNARSGSRYVEQLLSHWSVKSDDLRHSRPQYLGGGKCNISISEVLTTFRTEDIVATGEMAGHGIGIGNTNEFSQFFKEHGYVLGILSIIPENATYSQGMERTWYKRNKFDFAFPEFANIGEQEVYKGELYFDYTFPDNSDALSVWGYQSRYAEYKHTKSTVHGDFKNTLKYWHCGREFASAPALNSDFVGTNDLPTIEDRIFAVSDQGSTNKFYVMLYNDVKAIRPLPTFGEPI